MPVSSLDISGSPNIGVYALATNRFVLVPPRTPDSKIRRIEKVFSVPVVRITLGGTVLLGVLAAANSNGVVVPNFVEDEEVRILSGLIGNIVRLESRRTAFSNLVLANDHGAIVSEPLYRDRDVVRGIRDALGVETAPGRIAGLSYVGSLVAANNKAALAHPLLMDEERKLISEVLKVRVDVGTVNGGSPFVSSGILVNDNGVAIGPLTVGPELMIIANLFGV